MIYFIYSIFDKVTGNYLAPFYQINDASAERFFVNVSKAPDNLGVSSDWQLYKLGTFNSETGVVQGLEKPYFLRGIDNE